MSQLTSFKKMQKPVSNLPHWHLWVVHYETVPRRAWSSDAFTLCQAELERLKWQSFRPITGTIQPYGLQGGGYKQPSFGVFWRWGIEYAMALTAVILMCSCRAEFPHWHDPLQARSGMASGSWQTQLTHVKLLLFTDTALSFRQKFLRRWPKGASESDYIGNTEAPSEPYGFTWAPGVMDPMSWQNTGRRKQSWLTSFQTQARNLCKRKLAVPAMVWRLGT